MSDKKIAIIGGGIAGITCAAALQKRGLAVTVFEQAPECKEIGAVLGVLPNGMQVIRDLGIFNAIISKGGIMEDFRVLTDQGKTIRNTIFNYELPAVVIRRSDLLSALLSAFDHSALRLAHKLTQVTTTAEGKIGLRFENGNTELFDAVIGADGIHSVVRKRVVGDDAPIYRGYNLWRGVCKVDNPTSFAGEVWGSGKRVGFYPMPDNHMGWWAAYEEEFQAEDFPDSRRKLMQLFGDWIEPLPTLFRSTDHIIKNSISDRKPLKKWFDNEAVLIGDAAHCTTPNLGQGANMAMESALILSRCIEKYGVCTEAFASYENIQFIRTKDINETSLMLGSVSQWSNPLMKGVRNSVLKNVPYSIVKKIYDRHYSYNPALIAV